MSAPANGGWGSGGAYDPTKSGDPSWDAAKQRNAGAPAAPTNTQGQPQGLGGIQMGLPAGAKNPWDATGGNHEVQANAIANQLSNQGNAFQGRQSTNLNNMGIDIAADRAASADARGRMQQGLGLQQAAAAGQAPSGANIRTGMGVGAGLGGAFAAAHGHGGPAAGMQGLAGNSGQVIGAGASARGGEMGQAQDAYMGGANALRSNDIGQQGLEQQFGIQNAQLSAAQRAQNDKMQQTYEGMGVNLLGDQQRAMTSMGNTEQGNAAQLGAQNYTQNQGLYRDLASAGAGGVGGAFSYLAQQPGAQGPASPQPYSQNPDVVSSDANAKANIQPAGATPSYGHDSGQVNAPGSQFGTGAGGPYGTNTFSQGTTKPPPQIGTSGTPYGYGGAGSGGVRADGSIDNTTSKGWAGFGGGGEAGAGQIATNLSAKGAGFQGRGADVANNDYIKGARANSIGDMGAQNAALSGLYDTAMGHGAAIDATRDTGAAALAQGQQQQAAIAHSVGGSAGVAADRSAANQGASMAVGSGNAVNAAVADQQAAARGAYMQGASGMYGLGQHQQNTDQGLAYAQGQLNYGQNAQNDAMQGAYQGMANQATSGQIAADASAYNTAQNAANMQAMAENASGAAWGRTAIGGTMGLVTGGLSSDINGKTNVASDMTGKQNVSSDAREKFSKHAISEGTKASPLSSDARGKDVRPGGDTVADQFMDHLTPFTYEYKDPQNEPSSKKDGGRYLGVMAQNLEQAPEVGRQIVTDTPRGKVLEGGALMSGLAAATGRLHERTDAIEAAIAAMQAKKKGRA